MTRFIRLVTVALLAFVPVVSAVAAPTPASLRERVSKSLVVVRYTFENELGRRELEGQGVVVSEDGLTICSLSVMPLVLADSQIRSVKLVIPAEIAGGIEPEEIPAKLIARDDRCDLLYVRPNEARTWTALKPVDATFDAGQTVFSVGLLHKSAGYTPYVRQAMISATLRGPVPLVLTDNGLCVVGSPVLSESGEFVGIVNEQSDQNPFLNPPDQNTFSNIANPPRLFVPAGDFMLFISGVPTEPTELPVPWIGVAAMNGVSKEVADYFGLGTTPAVQIGEIVPGAAADAAGLKSGDIVVSVNGNEIPRGDTTEELPMILGRMLQRFDVGQVVTFGVVREPKAKPIDILLTLGKRPAGPNTASRFWAEDLGFTVRGLVFQDRYLRRVDPDFTGVAVTFVKQGSSAQAGLIRPGDVITRINQTAVVDVEQFEKEYKAFRAASPKDAVVFEVLRGVQTEIIRIEPPR